MDVLYILGTGSQWDDNEIRYSLRSLERYARNVDRVFVVGADPGFFSDEIHHFLVEDPKGRSYNHYHKVRWAFENTDISDEILCNYDDNFFIADIDVSQYPFYHRGAIDPRSARKSNRAFQETHKILTEHGKPTLHFGQHCPIRYERKKFLALSHIFELSADRPMSIRTMYANWHMMEPPVRMADCKLKTVGSREDIENALRGRHVFSIHDRAIKNGIADYLADLFPEPSRYERQEAMARTA